MQVASEFLRLEASALVRAKKYCAEIVRAKNQDADEPSFLDEGEEETEEERGEEGGRGQRTAEGNVIGNGSEDGEAMQNRLIRMGEDDEGFRRRIIARGCAAMHEEDVMGAEKPSDEDRGSRGAEEEDEAVVEERQVSSWCAW